MTAGYFYTLSTLNRAVSTLPQSSNVYTNFSNRHSHRHAFVLTYFYRFGFQSLEVEEPIHSHACIVIVKRIPLEILNDSYVFSAPECEKLVIGAPSLCVFVRPSLAPHRLDRFCSYLVFKSSYVIGSVPVNMNILRPKTGAPKTQNYGFVENFLTNFH
jgi:hypothetical protein